MKLFAAKDGILKITTGFTTMWYYKITIPVMFLSIIEATRTGEPEDRTGYKKDQPTGIHLGMVGKSPEPEADQN